MMCTHGTPGGTGTLPRPPSPSLGIFAKMTAEASLVCTVAHIATPHVLPARALDAALRRSRFRADERLCAAGRGTSGLWRRVFRHAREWTRRPHLVCAPAHRQGGPLLAGLNWLPQNAARASRVGARISSGRSACARLAEIRSNGRLKSAPRNNAWGLVK